MFSVVSTVYAHEFGREFLGEIKGHSVNDRHRRLGSRSVVVRRRLRPHRHLRSGTRVVSVGADRHRPRGASGAALVSPLPGLLEMLLP